MALNFPGPFELRAVYQHKGREHNWRMSVALDAPVQVGEQFANITGETPDGSTANLKDFVNGILTAIAKKYGTSETTFGIIELWQYTPNTFQATFVTSFSPTIQPSGNNAVHIAKQGTFTFRTLEGGIMKLQLMGINDSSEGNISTYPTGSATNDAIFDAVLDPTLSLAVGRDTSRPFTGLKFSVSQNEHMFRKATGRS